ncbi:unnamed protein product [Chrysoparadoxa australica]
MISPVVAKSIKPTKVVVDGDHTVNVTWSDGHESGFDAEWLRIHDNSVANQIEKNHASWPNSLKAWEAIPVVSFKDYMECEKSVHSLLRHINTSGLCIVEGCGVETDTVQHVAQRIAPLSHSYLYGDSFDVIVQEYARNIAYTHEALPYHQDLVYYESAPGLQLLHCLRFDEELKGGKTIWLDALAAANVFRRKHPKEFDVLKSVPATFQKIRDSVTPEEGDGNDSSATPNAAAASPAHLTYQRPHIEVTADGEIVAVNWAPMFEGMLSIPIQDQERSVIIHPSHWACPGSPFNEHSSADTSSQLWQGFMATFLLHLTVTY